MRSNLVPLFLAALLIGGCTASYVGLMALVGSAMGEAFISVDGTVRDEWGSPVEGAAVSLHSSPKYRLYSGDRSDGTGAFSVHICYGGWGAPDVKDTPFSLRVEKEGFIPVKRQIVEDTKLRIVLLRKAGLPLFTRGIPEPAPR
jgi:hypothetical protein